MAVGNFDDNRWQQRQALEGEDNGGVLEQSFVCGGGKWPKQRRRTRAVEDSGGGGGGGGGGGVGDVKRANHIALSKATTAQIILRLEGRPDIALHDSISLSYRTQ